MIHLRFHSLARKAAGFAASICFGAVVSASIALAQEAGVEAPKGEIDPFGAGAGARPAAERAKSQAPAEAKAEPLAIELLRSSNPATPVDLLRAAKAALEFGRPDESKRYLAKLIASQPPDDALAAQTLRFGDFLFRLSRTKEVQPEGKQVADLVFGAGRKFTENPEVVGELVGKLSAAEASERQGALMKLSQAGVVVIPQLLRALADEAREKEHVYIQAALVRLGGVSLRPMLGAIDAPDAALKARVIEALGHMRSSQNAVHVVRLALDPGAPPAVQEAARAALQRMSGAVPDQQEGRRYLAREAQRFWRGELPFEADADGLVELWTWDASQGTVVSRKLPKADAAAALAARVAEDLHALSPADGAAERLMLLTGLEVAKMQAGLNRPLPLEADGAGVRAVKAGSQIMSLVLADALSQARIPAALGAIEALAKIGDAVALESQGEAASPLAEALTFSDRRVRCAAALATAKLAPVGEFIGASRMSHTLSWLAGAEGAKQVLVADPRVEKAQTTIGLLIGAGYEGIAASTGGDLFEKAVTNADLEFILIDEGIDSPAVLDLIQWLRRDYRSARIPVGIMARTEQLERLQQALADDRFSIVFPRLHSDASAFVEIERLKALAGRNQVGSEERLAQAEEAKEALARIEALSAALEEK